MRQIDMEKYPTNKLGMNNQKTTILINNLRIIQLNKILLSQEWKNYVFICVCYTFQEEIKHPIEKTCDASRRVKFGKVDEK